jgi:hypothetical protein
MEPDGLCEGGVIVGLVAFRMPDSGLALPLEVHYPDGRVHYVTCRRCADSGRIGPKEPCLACVQPSN